MDVNIILPIRLHNLIQIDNKVRVALRQSFYDIGKDLVKTSDRNILRKKSGRAYLYKGRFIKSGRAGESFANRSGKARRSIDFKVQGSFQMKYFSSGVKYIKYLEKGTKKMKPRPAMLIALKQNKTNMTVIFEKNIRRYLG